MRAVGAVILETVVVVVFGAVVVNEVELFDIDWVEELKVVVVDSVELFDVTLF